MRKKLLLLSFVLMAGHIASATTYPANFICTGGKALSFIGTREVKMDMTEPNQLGITLSQNPFVHVSVDLRSISGTSAYEHLLLITVNNYFYEIGPASRPVTLDQFGYYLSCQAK